MPERSERFDAARCEMSGTPLRMHMLKGKLPGRDLLRLEFLSGAGCALRRSAGLRLLDVGCGTGYFAREMARRGAGRDGCRLSPVCSPCAEVGIAAPLAFDIWTAMPPDCAST